MEITYLESKLSKGYKVDHGRELGEGDTPSMPAPTSKEEVQKYPAVGK